MSAFTAQGSMFEGLFVRALRVEPDSAVADELRAAGFDLRAVQPTYDTDVWARALDVAWAHWHPTLPRFEAWRRVGRDFITGYLQTVVGRFIAVVLPLMTVERFIEHVPSFVRTGLGGVTCEVERTSPTSARVTLNGPHPGAAAHLCGVLEVCFEQMRATGTFTPRDPEGDRSSLDVSWG